MKPNDNELANRHTYHAPTEEKKAQYERIRQEALYFSTIICALCPDTRELSLALTKIEEAVFWANASIARKV